MTAFSSSSSAGQPGASPREVPGDSHRSPGRPRAISPEMLADAAGELFLERGYDDTSVTQITQRAGVSRATFFNYFTAKADVIWSAWDAELARIEAALREQPPCNEQQLCELLQGDPQCSTAAKTLPELLALAIVHAELMGLEAELRTGRAVRQLTLAEWLTPIAAALSSAQHGVHNECETRNETRDRIAAAALAAAYCDAVWAWAQQPTRRASLHAYVREHSLCALRLLAV